VCIVVVVVVIVVVVGCLSWSKTLPKLEDMSDEGTMARWWQFWKHG
jgi:hypothetical protein